MRPAEIAALQQALSTVTRDPQIQQRLWQAMCDAVYAIEFNGLHTESADDGECRSCVAGKCVTGPECVTLGRDDTQAPAATEAPSDKAATITGLIAQIRAAKSMARRDALFEKIIEVWEATPAPAVGATPEKWSPDAKTWAAYVAGMIETYLNFDEPKLSYANPNKGREAAIAGIIERRMWSGPAVGASQPKLKVWLTKFPESNGKTNWTALLMREEPFDGLVGNGGGIQLARGELWNRVAYEAECTKYLLGLRDTEPYILDYGDDITSPDDWKGETR